MNRKDYNKNELEELMEQFGYFVDDRVNMVYERIRESKNYKEKYNTYFNLYEKLVNKYPVQEIEKFAESTIDLYNLENLYIYSQGFLDGCMLKENFKDNIKKK